MILIHGEDNFQSLQKLKEIKKNFKKEDPSNLNLIEIDCGESILFDEIENKLKSVPFLSKKRLIILRNLFTKNKSKKLREQVSDLILENKIPKTTNLVVYEPGKFDKRIKLFKFLDKEREIMEFGFLQETQLTNWIQKEIEKRKGKIEKRALEKLVLFVGPNLWQMVQEIEKLVNYKDGGLVTGEDVELLVKSSLDTNIFNFIDALGRKQTSLAIKLLHEQIDSGAHELYLLKMMVYQFRNLIIVKDLLEQRTPVYEIARKAKMHPFVVQKTTQQVQNFSLDRLKEIYNLLFETDVKVKTGKADGILSLDLLVSECVT
ncbi:DNA polymerase III subunit delta [bacterium (Candidatus Torokbacteria) CG_4_10_14_0_2_um_filter_35_8]|nr:MAG: DNA polymerase III subunit delta [bacterium (Candidatus Torokbacteria) CG_4_10_14_0_2_um_filter_35_8]